MHINVVHDSIYFDVRIREEEAIFLPNTCAGFGALYVDP